MTVKVVLFIDYQNIYRGARNAFGLDSNPHMDGQFQPKRLGELIIRKGKSQDRELKEVRIYRGRPDSSKDPKGYGANRRQCAAWARDPLVTVITRTLRYPQSWPSEREEEKGIDVALAVDFAMMAVKGGFDVGVVMSTDTDLKPAIEAVRNLRGNPFPVAEVAAWKSSIKSSGRLSVPGRQIWCHWLDENDYLSVFDATDYRL